MPIVNPATGGGDAAPPLVTAIAVCYNHERFVCECLDSIKAQQYPNLEILIADDCSKDRSRELIRDWMTANPSLPVTYVPSENNRGVCKVLNHLLSLASGKYISLIATDDRWEPDKIWSQVNIMEALPEKVGVLYSDACQMDEHGQSLPARFIESHRHFEAMPEGDLNSILWTGNFLPAMTTLIRRSVFDKIGNYDEALAYEDWDMWLRISEQYHFAYSSRISATYRVHRTSMSKSAVDRMEKANELIFIKNLKRRTVPRTMMSQALNFAVRRAFRLRDEAKDQGRKLLEELTRIHPVPRLKLGSFLYRVGLDYGSYERCIRLGRLLIGPLARRSQNI